MLVDFGVFRLAVFAMSDRSVTCVWLFLCSGCYVLWTLSLRCLKDFLISSMSSTWHCSFWVDIRLSNGDRRWFGVVDFREFAIDFRMICCVCGQSGRDIVQWNTGSRKVQRNYAWIRWRLSNCSQRHTLCTEQLFEGTCLGICLSGELRNSAMSFRQAEVCARASWWRTK